MNTKTAESLIPDKDQRPEKDAQKDFERALKNMLLGPQKDQHAAKKRAK